MAKARAFGFSNAKPIVIRQSASRPIIKVSAPRAIAHRVKRGVHKFAGTAARAAAEEKHRIVACAAAGIVGYAEKENWNLPHVEMLGMPATYGLGLWFLQKSGYLRSKTLSHACTGLLAVASYKFGKGDTLLALK